MGLYNSKSVGKQYDEMKEFLSIARGTSKKVSLKEEFGGVNTSMSNSGGMNPLQNQPQTPEMGGGAGTSDMEQVQQAIQNSICDKFESNNGQTVVSGVVKQNDKECLRFTFNTSESDPVITTLNDKVFLNEDLLKSINQISAYFTDFQSN